ncbi:transposable element Tc3 transposase [Trichonephila clavipes]|nr:transposable element Tc3 transposase [Trichonephila clavipes]
MGPNEIAVVPDFYKRILFNDEAHFWLNGYVNKQNCRIWSEANPQVSCDFTPLDYLLWGYVKSLVYADKPQTLDQFEDNIRRVIADIRPQLLEKVIENWTSRLDYIRASRGSHMPEIIFKMQINSKVDSEDDQKLQSPHNQELEIDEFIEMHGQEQDIQEIEFLVQSEYRTTGI